jgi:putative ABC transport system permease protein
MKRRLGKSWQRMLATVRNESRDMEFQVEMEDHVQLLAERYRRHGMTPDAAIVAARQQFGNTALLEEDRRAIKTLPGIDAVRGDLAYAARTLRRNPGFAAAAVATMALGIGAITAIFGICNAVLFKPLPYAEPSRIMTLWERTGNGKLSTVAPANFVDWRNMSRSFSDVAGVNSFNFILGGQDDPAQLLGAGVSSNFFSLLGVRFTLGRNFLPEEDRPGHNYVAILSHRIWQQRFGADSGIAGRHITLNDNSYVVIGVLAADFQFASNPADFQARSQADIWVPLALNTEKLQRGTHPLRVVAKLRGGVELAQAQAELDVIAANLARAYPADDRDKGITAIPLAEQVTATVRTALKALLGAVGLVLLIACANVANLLLSRAASRQKEIAVRIALGASRGRLARQLLTESLFLAIIGGIAGVVLALIALAAVAPHLPADLSRAAGVTVDARIIGFSFAISLATGILFGLGPLFGLRRVSAGESLKQSNRIAGGTHAGLRNALAVAQIAIAIILLIGAGLMAKSFWALLHTAPGFRTEHVLTARLSLPRLRYPDNRRIAAFEQELIDRLRATPGIQSAGFTTYLPLSGSDNGWAFFIEGRPPLPVGVYNMAKYRPVSAGYFETIGIPLLAGRSLTPADTTESPWVVVVNASMARQYWGTENPVGQRLHFAGPKWRTVVGVVGDVLHEGLDGEAKAEMYMPVEQAANTESGPTIVVRTPLEAAAAATELKAAISAIDRTTPVDRIETMGQLVSGSVAQPRFRTLVLVAFSVLALAMASIGIYGVMNYLVIQRTREFGIRLSVGATGPDVLRLVLRRAAVLISVGTGLGLAGSILLVRLIAKLLFETAPLDPLTFLAAPAFLAGVALAASYVPARRATRVDPMIALRDE